MIRRSLALTALFATALSGCAKSGEIDASGGIGITAVRSACPIVGVPAGTGDVTLFDPPASRDENAIDVVAAMSSVRGTCNDTGSDVVTTVNFEVRGRRTRTDVPRDVVLPYFLAIVRGGTAVTAKRVAQVNLHFDAGQATASTTGQATSVVSRAAATLPDDIRKELNKPRKAGDQDAAVDPLATPKVRQAVLRASFEALVGFQLTEEQLRYNAVR